jgi:hypothetical protein
MSPPEKGIVYHHHFAITPRHVTDNSAHCIGHAAQMHGNVCCLRTEGAIGIEDGAGEIKTVTNIGGKGGAAQHCAHFVAHCFNAAGKQIEFDGVHGVMLTKVERKHSLHLDK